MKMTVLGSGGCMVIPKPLCRCRVCSEARQKGGRYERGGPSLFLHDHNILIDTPADVARQLNRFDISRLETVMLTHLDPDHIEGFRVLEQITINFRTWRAFPEKQIRLLLPEPLMVKLRGISSVYGSQLDFFETSGFVQCMPFQKNVIIEDIMITAVPVEPEDPTVFIYVFEKKGQKLVIAPCDIKPFPEKCSAIQDADLLMIQPGIFETGLQDRYIFPENHISRTTLYTFNETLALSRRINASKTVFIHLEEYWHRSYEDYLALEQQFKNIIFAYDGLSLKV